MDLISLLLDPTFWLILLSAAVFALYRYGTSTFHIFSDQGIPGPKPLPFVGNLWGVWRQNNKSENDLEMVRKYGNVFGYFEGLQPTLWVSDPELIKKILVKDFDHFMNHKDFGVRAKVFRKMVFFIQGSEWKDVRTSISPAFSTGKIKKMTPQIKDCVDKMVVKLSAVAENVGKIDTKQEFSSLFMEVIARCAFGMKIDNLGGKDDPFSANCGKLFTAPTTQSPMVLIPALFPKMVTGDMLFVNEAWDFFKNVVENVIQDRSKSNQKYNDFLELATEAIGGFTKEENGVKEPMWSREEVSELVSAQALEFLLDGFETSSTTMSLVCFMLAKHPEVQEKLYNDVINKLEDFGEISHEMILEMPYAEHIIHEVLRYFPLIDRIDRCCNKDITYDGIHIKKGMIVMIPAYAIHHMEEYYPEPETFNPDRWSTENGNKINPNVFFPFGMGPRGCIGVRIALEQMKIALCTIVKNFRIYSTDETPDKLGFTNGYNMFFSPVTNIVGIERREA